MNSHKTVNRIRPHYDTDDGQKQITALNESIENGNVKTPIQQKNGRYGPRGSYKKRVEKQVKKLQSTQNIPMMGSPVRQELQQQQEYQAPVPRTRAQTAAAAAVVQSAQKPMDSFQHNLSYLEQNEMQRVMANPSVNRIRNQITSTLANKYNDHILQ